MTRVGYTQLCSSGLLKLWVRLQKLSFSTSDKQSMHSLEHPPTHVDQREVQSVPKAHGTLLAQEGQPGGR